MFWLPIMFCLPSTIFDIVLTQTWANTIWIQFILVSTAENADFAESECWPLQHFAHLAQWGQNEKHYDITSGSDLLEMVLAPMYMP